MSRMHYYDLFFVSLRNDLGAFGSAARMTSSRTPHVYGIIKISLNIFRLRDVARSREKV